MTGHYILIIILIAIIIYFQFKVFFRTNRKRQQFNSIFPQKAEDEWIVLKNEGVQIVSKKRRQCSETIQRGEDELEKIQAELKRADKSIARYTAYRNEAAETGDSDSLFNYDYSLQSELSKKQKLQDSEKEWKRAIAEAREHITELNALQTSIDGEPRLVIIDSINKYLEKNKDAVTDFNLIRDIIDRNTDSIEEEIQTQIPIPLYYGLMGTMLGILIGVMALVFSGSLGNLLSTFTPPADVTEGSAAYEAAKMAFEEKATNGVTALFAGVALAMISSIIGIFLTTIGSIQTKDIKVEVEAKKHAFISWLQAELLPKISSDFSSALIQLGHDITGFNKSFSSNAKVLQKTIFDVSQATEAQANLLHTIEQLDIAKIAKANIKVYESLSSCTQQIASLAEDLHSIHEDIKGIGTFMENGINEYERRHTFIQDASGKVDLALQKGQEQLSNEARALFDKYDELLNTLYMRSETTTKQLADKYDVQAESLHKAIVEKLTDVRHSEDELKNLVSVKSSIANLEKATIEQNRKIDSLTQSIRDLVQIKVTGGTSSVSVKLPKLYKILIISTTSIIAFAGLFIVVVKVLELFGIIF